MCAVPNMAVFCSSSTSRFPGMLLTYFLNYFEIVPVAPIITGITFVFTFHIRCIIIFIYCDNCHHHYHHHHLKNDYISKRNKMEDVLFILHATSFLS